MDGSQWLAINYTLPSKPSRSRVYIWRKLKKAGAVNIQQSMWLLPFNDENYHTLKEIKQDVIQNGGEAFIMQSVIERDSTQVVIERFNSARNEEYMEVMEQCEEFFKEISKETAAKNFSFAEIEENEEELDKLKGWYEKILSRDFFEASLKEEANKMLSKCNELFEEFCMKVYEFNDDIRS